MSVETQTVDNLLLATDEVITERILKVESGQGVVTRGEILKKGTTGLVKMALDADVPYTVALDTVDATSAVKDLRYVLSGTLLAASMSTAGAGTVAGYKDKLRDINILTF